MSAPTTRQSYGDCFELWEKAIEAPEGIRFRVINGDVAINLRMRLQMARQIDRKDNLATYELGHPMHGSSIYDPLQVLIREDADLAWWVYIEPRAVHIIGEIEELQPQDDTQWVQNSQPRLISHIGAEPLPKRLEYTSSAPIEPSLSKPSTPQDKQQPIQTLRRL